MTDKTSPRPWYHVGRPWSDIPGLIYSGSEDPHAGNMVADVADSLNPGADADLIVAAVNGYPSGKHELGQPHRYRIECEVCGHRGHLQLSVEPQSANPATAR